MALARPWPRRCTRSRSGRSSPQALADAQHGDGAGLLRPLRPVLPAPARRHVRQRARGLPGDQLHGLPSTGRPSRRTTPTPPRSRPSRPGSRSDTIGSYACTFFPPPTDPRIAITGEGRGADRGDRHHRRPGDAARRHPQDGRGARGRPAGDGRRRISTPATASTPARRRRSTTTSSTRSATCRLKVCAALR